MATNSGTPLPEAAKPEPGTLARTGSAIKKGLGGLGRFTMYVMGGILASMILLVVVDVILRRIFNNPLPFSLELMGFGLVVVVWSAILFSTMKERHISVDIITSHFPLKVRRVLNVIADFIGMGLLLTIGWRCILYAMQLKESGQESVMLDLPLYPFISLVALGAICAGCMLLVSFIESVKDTVKK